MKPCSRKRTLLPRMVLLLLTYAGGGAIVNVAVAWGCYYFGTLKTVPTDHNVAWWSTHPAALTPTQPVFSQNLGKVGAAVDIAHNGQDDSGWMHGIRVRSGLPCLALVGTHWTYGEKPRTVITPGLVNYPDTIALPYFLLWPGFAINTVFYAAILWLFFTAPGFVRRRIRARRGQCPSCAYPIGTNPFCTECGKPLPKRLGA